MRLQNRDESCRQMSRPFTSRTPQNRATSNDIYSRSTFDAPMRIVHPVDAISVRTARSGTTQGEPADGASRHTGDAHRPRIRSLKVNMSIRLISSSVLAAASLAFSSTAFSRTVIYVTHPLPVAVYAPPPPHPVYYYAPPAWTVPVAPVVVVPPPAAKPTSVHMTTTVPVAVPPGYAVVRTQAGYAVVPAANVRYVQPTMVAMPVVTMH